MSGGGILWGGGGCPWPRGILDSAYRMQNGCFGPWMNVDQRVFEPGDVQQGRLETPNRVETILFFRIS
jgi:hypothetical protein